MNFHMHKRLVIFISILLAAIIALLVVSFVSTYKRVVPERLINSSRFSNMGRDRTVLGQSDVSSISAWMTFDYINHVFALPPEYLKTALGIGDSRYPGLTISRYAKESGSDETAVTAQVQSAVSDYFAAAGAQ